MGKLKDKYRNLIYVFLAILIITGFIGTIMNVPKMSFIGGSEDGWMGYWGGMVGSFFGIIGAFYVMKQ